MRSLAAIAALLLATGSIQPLPPTAGQPIRAEPVPLDRADPAMARVGSLRFLDGWVLTSRDRRFGGVSALLPRADGSLLAIGDRGGVFRIVPRPGRAPIGTVIGMLPGGPAAGEARATRDAESIAGGLTGPLWIGFEDANAIWRYDARLGRAEVGHRPTAMRGWPPNGGAEAMVQLADGRTLVFSETVDSAAGTSPGLIFAGDPTDPGAKPRAFAYRPPPGYSVTDAALLPDGRLLMLHRRVSLFDGFTATLAILDPRRIGGRQAAVAREIARLQAPLTVDNFEGLAITKEGVATTVWIASDDNFNSVQRSLLLRFRLVN